MQHRSTVQDPYDRQLARAAAGREAAEQLEKITSSVPAGFRHELLALSSRIRLCNDPQNAWLVHNAPASPSIGRDRDRMTASIDRYDAVGRFWRCGSKLCPDCLARTSRTNRKRLREALNAQKRHRGERYYFTTFTIPNPGLSLIETRSIVAHAWTLFRKRKLCVSLIRGGSKTEEFTVTPHGYHYHLHCLWLSKYLSYQEVRRVWTDCVEASFREHGREFVCHNKDGLLSVKVKPVEPNERIVQEVCKYITKSDSWKKLRSSDLLEVAMIRKWHRMFELFGSFRSSSSSEAAEEDSILDTRPPKGGMKSAAASYWRDRIVGQNIDDYLSDLYDEFNRCINGRMRQLELRYPGLRIFTYAELLTNNPSP